MSTRIICPRCDGRVDFPPSPTTSIVCPFCQQFLVAVDPRSGASWTPRRPWSRWARWAMAAAVWYGYHVAWNMHAAYLRPDMYHAPATDNPLYWLVVAVAIYVAWARRWLP